MPLDAPREGAASRSARPTAVGRPAPLALLSLAPHAFPAPLHSLPPSPPDMANYNELCKLANGPQYRQIFLP